LKRVKEDAMQSHQEYKHSESRELFEKTFFSQLDAIFILNSKIPPQILDCNPAATRLFGYSIHEMIGQTTNFLHVDETSLQSFQNQLYPEISEKGFFKLSEYKMRRKDGTVIFTEHSIVPLMDPNSKRTGWVSVVRDITEKKRSMENLQNSEEKYRCLFEMESDALFLIRNCDGQLLEANNAAIELYGYGRKDLLKMKNTDLSAEPNDTRKATLEHRREVPVRYHRKRNGTIFPVEITASHFPWQDHEVHIAAIRDITHRIEAEKEKDRLEKQLSHVQRMEATGNLASGISHNFRNILAVILMNCDILKRKYGDSKETSASIETMINYTKKGSALVDDLLEFSRQETKKIFQPLNLSEVLKEIYLLISKTFDKKISIRFHCSESIPINGEQSDLGQVIMNLCTNARDAMPNGGVLDIEARTDENQALVVITDTGTGMDKKTKEKCFEPFFTTKPVDKGTGLGLSTAYWTVKKHGGEIKVDSELNQGTTFKLFFPLSGGYEKMEPNIPSMTQTFRGKKILVADDDIEICKLLKQLLSPMGYMVEYTDDGISVLEKYKSWEPDAILLDRNMPNIDGISCAKRIINFDPRAKIIVISGYDIHDLSPQEKKLIKGYLTKPIDTNQLEILLGDLLAT